MEKYFNNLYTQDFECLKQEMEDNLLQEKKMFIITANPETYMLAEKNKQLRKIVLDKQNTVVADGIGIVQACKKLKMPITKIPGVDITASLLALGNKHHKRILLLGASKEVITLLTDKMKKNYPNLQIVGTSDGYCDNKEAVFSELLKKNPDIIMVALGIPNQELLIDNYYKSVKKGIFIGVGGSFDVLSGYKKRAPKFFLKTNTEWLYRIIKEPKRIKRFYQNNVRFVLKTKKRIGK